MLSKLPEFSNIIQNPHTYIYSESTGITDLPSTLTILNIIKRYKSGNINNEEKVFLDKFLELMRKVARKEISLQFIPKQVDDT